MINIQSKVECCGCEACVQVCPKKCINLYADSQGFLYPIVCEESCIDCSLCETVCPVLNKVSPQQNSSSTLYAVKAIDNHIRVNSSSGGFFSVLSEYILNRNGVVYGAAFDDVFNVFHTRVETKASFPKLRGSKYVQSRIGQTFTQCKHDLDQGKQVLFSGTPCQISALGHFLRREYENLIKVEVVCHGVPSPMIFKKYLEESILSSGDNKVITKVNFRTKLEGWKKYYFTVEYNENGMSKVYNECVTDSLYMKGFLNDLYIRPSCFECPAKNFTSAADFTIADFWGQDIAFPEFDDDKGVSAVFLNTKKANSLFSQLEMITQERRYTDFIHYNPSLIQSAKMTLLYSKFWNLYAISKQVKTSIEGTLDVSIVERILYKLKSLFLPQ